MEVIWALKILEKLNVDDVINIQNRIIRAIETGSNTTLEPFRGTTSLTPIGLKTVSDSLGSSAQTLSLHGLLAHSQSEMDLYALMIYNRTLSNAELKQMFRYFQNEFLRFQP